MKKISFICIGLLSLLLYTSCEHHSHHAEEATYLVTQPIRKDTSIFKEYVCQIRSFQHIELRALEKGYLQNIYIDEGQFVKKGQLMFRIMPLIYQAEVEKAEAEAKFVEVEYLNTKQLADKNIVSQSELALAKAKLDKAQAELALARTHLSFTEVKAPFDGIMGRFNVRLGSLVDEGELLTTLSDNSKVWVYFNVPEAEYLDFATSDRKENLLKVKLQMANGKLFDQEGVVETIEADFNNETGNIAFRATFANPKGILRHGETGNILMPVHLENVLLIPQKATFEILGKKYVFVIDQNGVANMREIVTDTEMPHLFEIKKGISDNEKILIEGLRKVKHGDEIKCDLVSMQKVLAELNHLHAE
ncbi:efflux RND transporter periplasmic adaptor subunit [Thermoflexibacter ruber]|uniref:Membrane fusion protein, multidrug efflux system n=1 Tax=Thermoflexibacter ruber TaxID=1003 RepID=A0A1I2IQM7_9BACT|nr:efflux RND transporter periplasmic adaptor subunit [Thermoflexibacter ruber]SFF43943.1 membrane fusion protein, multidrug efflux system [Thermoflexibacter ruber]